MAAASEAVQCQRYGDCAEAVKHQGEYIVPELRLAYDGGPAFWLVGCVGGAHAVLSAARPGAGPLRLNQKHPNNHDVSESEKR